MIGTEGLVALAASALTGAITLFATSQQSRRQMRLDDRKRKFDRLEQLHSALSKLEYQAHKLQVATFAAITKGVAMTSESSGGHVSFHEAEMLIDFYAPGLRPNVAEIRAGFDKMFVAATDIKTVSGEKNNDDRRLIACSEGRKQIGAAMGGAKLRLAEMIREAAGII